MASADFRFAAAFSERAFALAALAAALSPLRVPFDAGDPDRTSSLYVAGPDEPAGARRHLDAQRARGGPGASIVVGVDLAS